MATSGGVEMTIPVNDEDVMKLIDKIEEYLGTVKMEYRKAKIIVELFQVVKNAL